MADGLDTRKAVTVYDGRNTCCLAFSCIYMSCPLRPSRICPSSCAMRYHPDHELLSETSLKTLKASLYASNNALTRVLSDTNASSSNSKSAKRSGL